MDDFDDDRVVMSSKSARCWSRGLAKVRAVLAADVLGFSTEHLICAELRITPLQGRDDDAKSTLDRELDARVRPP
ncbi:hypothetical protein ASG56_06240 [Rhodococcus sp. Leaf7]|uniref:hypothetical protein n=1 Tax=unclassified Rhodococcus (in: high G+C Gram-positive bacteria) TaxID=192944 RepID=UPI0006F655ED|nr:MULTISPECIES: hypothetical protein [unclassified Rhodococcus (in: high G+C Gram-positive bacteria)]KQU07139.1 hypothetical protein ASG56_06240 [Rhodococcus sp. Leaf7]KQU42657.1 hypothetical protein ASG64_06240 [Rhodococcus sp. Leaf247]